MPRRWFAGISVVLAFLGQLGQQRLCPAEKTPQSAPNGSVGGEQRKSVSAGLSGRLPARAAEKLDRGLIARPAGEGKVYLSWRLLETDPPDVGFHVYRRIGSGEPVRLTKEPITKTTDFLADAPRLATSERQCFYFVRPVQNGQEGSASSEVPASDPKDQKPYVSIALQGQYTFQKVGIADLDGDGRLDFVIKQPGENIDPAESYWKPSPDTYKLEAYRHDGQFLWRYDLGWAIERGIWYSPYVVYDLDGDGRAEVAAKTGQGDPRDPDGRVRKGPEYLTIFEGQTGKLLDQTDWPSREGFGDDLRGYNLASRNQLGIAYLDGRRPSLIVARGTYALMKVVAYDFRDGKLQQRWRWDNTGLPRSWQGQGAHWMHCADIDADGRDEVLLGSSVLDDNGKPLWTTGLGHPDHFYLGDIDPGRPGLEIYYGIEARQRERNGMCLVEAATGKILWGHEGPTRHVHSCGMCSDIDPRWPGSECYSADTDEKKEFAWARLRTAQGKVISEENLGGFGARCVYWDADPQRELILGRRIVKYPQVKTPIGQIEGSFVAVADLVGDWREEIITSVPGQMRIYITTIPAQDRRISLMRDPIYRIDVAHAAMGYYQVPMLSYDLASSANP
ncbi:MAG: hypothetical protein NZ602_09910 [Thermoguttaceae bacterium]|nr:hypothetical protein [Thermoguttaceae bacterium]MDW8037129.1 hypothetical protein [Thermoguttaceae bacterium]